VSRRLLGALVVVAAVLAAGAVVSAQPTALRVKVFPGFQNLPFFAAQSQGTFARYGLTVDVLFTQTSGELRGGLAKGEFEIAHAGVDNAVAMAETAGADVVIVMGGDTGMNELFVQPTISGFGDLRGKTVIVDAPNTAYALVLRKMLLVNGLKVGQDYSLKPVGGTFQRLDAMKDNPDYAASMLNPPFSTLAEQRGLRSLGTAVSVIGPYQATAAFVMRPWARANAATLERYIAAYVEALRWAMARENETAAVALLVDRMKLAPDVAQRVYALATGPGGLQPAARLDPDGFRTVLALRAEMEGQWGGQAPLPDRYLDLTYYERALTTGRR
jgi:ABC-type nitrate/sulfonate/bicarbonate transport system substrate-binding protein